jgi:O-antigen ligase
MILSILAIPAALLLGVAISLFNPIYVIVAAGGALALGLMFLLRLDELMVALIVAAHILVDSYMGFAVYQPALLLALTLLAVCYLGQSTDHPWTKPRFLWLWLLFLGLTIFPMIKGGAYSLTNSFGHYLEIVFSPFIMFWLSNIIARDISGMRRVFQWMSLIAAIFAIHTLIEVTTGVFLFESARASTASAFQTSEGVSRSASFFGNPNGNGIFLATCTFLPLGLFIESKRFSAKILYLLELLLILMALMFTYSNGSWVATLAGLFAFLFLVGRPRYSVLMVVLVAALATIAFAVFPTQIEAQLAHARDQGDISLHFATWQTAAQVMFAYPLFGVGFGSQAYLTLSEPYRVLAQTKPLAEPDNSYLQWGAIAGIPVMLIFLTLLTLVFWFAWRNWRAVDARYRALFAGGICALIALSINSLSVDGWTSPIDVEFLGWMIAGVVASPFVGQALRHRPEPTVDAAAPTDATARVRAWASWIDRVRLGL